MVVAFVFGFDDKRPEFELNYWLLNFIKIALLVAVALVFREIVRKFIARKHGCDAVFDLWKITRIGFMTMSHFPQTLNLGFTKIVFHSIQAGIILPILISALSNGQIFFAVAGTSLVAINATYRIGRKYPTRVTDYETAKIVLAAPMANLLLAVLFKMLGGEAGYFSQFVFINSWLAIANMIPFPHLDGGRILFGSIPLYVFSLAFIVGVVILLNYLGVFSTLILSLLFAAVVVIVYYYYKVYK